MTISEETPSERVMYASMLGQITQEQTDYIDLFPEDQKLGKLKQALNDNGIYLIDWDSD